MTSTAKAFNEMAHDNFMKRYNQTEKVIPFKEEWANGTGYYDGAVDDVKLSPGEEAKSVSPAPNNRRMLFIGTHLGTVVLFERYTDGAHGTVVKNISSDMRRLGMIPDGHIGYDSMNLILGWSSEDNIGKRLERAYWAMSKA